MAEAGDTGMTVIGVFPAGRGRPDPAVLASKNQTIQGVRVMNTRWLLAVAISTAVGAAHADDLCAVNPYTQSEAQQGKVAFESHCALCHQFSMTGRVPGNAANESPDMKLLSEGDLKFLDNAAGNVPPLIGDKFFSKWNGKKSLAEFSWTVSSAANTFPATKMSVPQTYFEIAAYVLYRNCGRM